MAISNRRRTAIGLAAFGISATLAISGCTASTGSVDAGEMTGTLTMWVQSGDTPETRAITELIAQFEAEHEGVTIEQNAIEPADYNTTILTTPVEEIGDVLLLDGPNLAAYAYNGKIAPLDDWLDPETISNQTPAVLGQNTYDDSVYAISLINSGMGIWGNKALLDAAGVTMPSSAEDAWTAEEFEEVLAKLAALDADGRPLGISENYGLNTEWGTYGFTPVIWSGGASIFRDGKAEGALNSPEAIAAMTTFAGWRQYVDPDTDGQAFATGRVALNWVGHWTYGEYSEALGDDLIVGPLPDFGTGSKTGNGSIAWAMGGGTKKAALAAAFIDFLASDASLKLYSDASGAAPASITVAAASERYGEGGPLQLLGDQLTNSCPVADDPTGDCVAVARPVTPGYPVVTLEFSKALADIWSGGDVEAALTSAARAIDRDAADNNNYED